MILSRRGNWTRGMKGQKRILRQEEDGIDEGRTSWVTKEIVCNSKYKKVWDTFYMILEELQSVVLDCDVFKTFR